MMKAIRVEKCILYNSIHSIDFSLQPPHKMACTRRFLLVSLFYSVVTAFYVLTESGIKIDVVQVPEQCDILVLYLTARRADVCAASHLIFIKSFVKITIWQAEAVQCLCFVVVLIKLMVILLRQIDTTGPYWLELDYYTQYVLDNYGSVIIAKSDPRNGP